MVASFRFVAACIVGGCVAASPSPSMAWKPKHDKETCSQFHAEQAKFIESGILADLARGPEWGKANLSAERLREVELYITLDEQIKFACREATLTPELLHVEEIAKRLELNPNADPFAPLPPPDAQPAAASGEPDASGSKAPNGTTKKKSKPAAQAKPKPLAGKPPAGKEDDAYKGPPIAGNGPESAPPKAPTATP